MARSAALPNAETRRTRGHRLGFRIDEETKKQVERAAALERRSITDFCLTALVEATRETLARHETLALSEQDRKIFFDALIHPPEPKERLRRAFQEMQEQVVVE